MPANPFEQAHGGIGGNFHNGPIEEEDERNSLVKGGYSVAQQNQSQKVPIDVTDINDLSMPQKQQLKSKYPLSDRISMAMTQCCGANLSPRT